LSTGWRSALASGSVIRDRGDGAGARRAVGTAEEDREMINDAQIVLAGFVASAPSFRRTTRGTSTASLRVAYTPRHINRDTGEWADGETSFVTVLCWRTLADNVAMCLRKGEPVLVKGRLRVRPFQDKQGASRIAVEVDAQSVGHDLTRGVAHFSRTHRAAGETAAETAEAQAVLSGSPTDADHPDDGPADAPDGAAGNGAAGNGTAGNGAAGDDVLDDRAVAEFASEMIDALAADPASPDEAPADDAPVF
jgi:single-strand DNA-binding protein